MYRLMLYYLLLLVAAAAVFSQFGLLPYKPWDILSSGAFLVLICYLANRLLAFLFRTRPNLESRSITALILTLIVGPLSVASNFWFLTALAAIAMASKYLLVIKRRHIFNPAAFAAVAVALFLGEGASWWVGHQILLPFVLLGGLLVVAKIRRFHLVGSFLLGYLVFYVLFAFLGGQPLVQTLNAAKNLFLFSPLLFFSFVMLVEPLTGPQDRRWRLGYGFLIAAVAVILQKYFAQISYGLELSLLVGNLVARFVSQDPRLVLTLRRKQEVAANTSAFWFEPQHPFPFTAGQFLEWTLPHSHPDSRGVRRYFTIASSPTESRILLATKFSPDSSSFKKALNALKAGDDIIVSNREGEFVLPPTPSQPCVFIAGGIGITPFRSMIKDLSDRQNTSYKITLLYSCKTAKDVAFREIFEEGSRKLRLEVIYVLTDKLEAPKDWAGRVGFVDQEMIRAEVPDWQTARFYVSGPEPMVEAFEKMLSGMGVASGNIKRDYFPGYTETYHA